MNVTSFVKVGEVLSEVVQQLRAHACCSCRGSDFRSQSTEMAYSSRTSDGFFRHLDSCAHILTQTHKETQN